MNDAAFRRPMSATETCRVARACAAATASHGPRRRVPRALAVMAAAGLVAGAAPPASAAGFADAARLRTLCLGRGAARATCLGYLGGAIDALAAGGAAHLCLPPKLAAEQARLLFLNHLHAHPHGGVNNAATEVRAALAAAFPCPDRSPGPIPPPGERAPELGAALGTREPCTRRRERVGRRARQGA